MSLSGRKHRDSISKQKSQQKFEQKKIIIKNQKICMQNELQQQEYKSSIKKISHLNDKSFEQAVQEQNWKKAATTLQDLFILIQSTNYGINKKIMYHHLSVYHNNLALVCFQTGKLEESCIQMEKAIKNFQLTQGYILSREENLSHSGEFVKLHLQYCTLLSNIKKHLEAIISAQKCIQKLAQSFRMLQAICFQNSIISDTPDTIATQSQSRVKSQRVNFKRVVIKQAQKILGDLEQIPSSHKLFSQNKQIFEQKIKNMYFWKTNQENNAKSIKKEINQNNKQIGCSNRNLLGVQKTSNFTQQFSLGQLMSLSIRKMKQKVNCDTFYLLSSPKIVEMILQASVCYFTISVETRFNQLSADLSTLKITQKYKKLNKDEVIFKCKVLHLKAIQLAAKHLPPTNSYFSYILGNFNKNYKSVLDEINQESQSSLKSLAKSIEKYKQQNKQADLSVSYTGQYGMQNTNMNAFNLNSKTSKKLNQMSQKQIQGSTKKLEISINNGNTTIVRKRIDSKDKKVRRKSTFKKS